ncbi:Predicted oxidoreductase [Pustulibacterium marinum]|uniref:Predicted oxidoreductase n=1 Tax=Pustulibacterium marinum TaxID=1224947 RepID=A0A1I7HHY5_9FLAO|nr:aldo/keto reductase [Pustulibacterium marinum]SFU60315.1 Predicted oxidoreductase [Pustulibacterium marinum]
MKTLQLSKIIAGTMTWGKWGKKFSSQHIADLQNYYVGKGITSFDHADIYGDYTTEADFGKGFAESGIAREKVQFITKCGIQMVCENRDFAVKHYDYSKEHIIESVHNSLKNLQTDYIDVLLLHRPSPLMHPGVIAEAIQDLKEANKVLHFGVSNFTPSQVAMLSKYISVEINQIEFSLTHHEAMLNGSLDQMIENDIVPMAWSPLGNYFTKKYPSLKHALKITASKYKTTEDTVLLAWILKHPAGILPVIGTTQKERINKALEALEINLSLEDWFYILQIATGNPVA